MNLVELMTELANQLPTEEFPDIKMIDEDIQVALSKKTYTNERNVTIY